MPIFNSYVKLPEGNIYNCIIHYNTICLVDKILVAGLEHEFHDFPFIGNFIIPTDELIFFRGVGTVGQPPTRIHIA